MFWLSAFGLFYTFAGYPLMIAALSRLFGEERGRRASVDPVSVVVVVHNEGPRVAKKVASILATSNADLIQEILIGSDGSTDDPAASLPHDVDPRVKVIAFPERRGKASVVNDLVPRCRSEIVVLTDARQELGRDSIASLASNFADPSVGVVSGELVFRSSRSATSAARGISRYWQYEKRVRKHEGRFRGVPGVTGAFYAIRRSLFRPIPACTILDDVVVPMQIVSAGFHCAFDSQAIAYDTPSNQPSQEYLRKRRTIAGIVQLVVNQPRWLIPWRNPIWFEYVSHKIARLSTPLLLLIIATASVALSDRRFFLAAAVAQALFYGAALCGWVLQAIGWRSTIFGAPMMFVTLSLTTAAALWDSMLGRFSPLWRRAT